MFMFGQIQISETRGQQYNDTSPYEVSNYYLIYDDLNY